MRFAKAAQQAGVSHCSSVSSARANSSSWFVFMKTKGQLEEVMSGMGFSYTSIFRPGFLNRGNTDRLGEKIASECKCHRSQTPTIDNTTHCIEVVPLFVRNHLFGIHSDVHQRIVCVNTG